MRWFLDSLVLEIKKIPQVINGFKSSYRKEPHNMLKAVKLLSSFRFSANLVLVGLGSRLRLLRGNQVTASF